MVRLKDNYWPDVNICVSMVEEIKLNHVSIKLFFKLNSPIDGNFYNRSEAPVAF